MYIYVAKINNDDLSQKLKVCRYYIPDITNTAGKDIPNITSEGVRKLAFNLTQNKLFSDNTRTNLYRNIILKIIIIVRFWRF